MMQSLAGNWGLAGDKTHNASSVVLARAGAAGGGKDDKGPRVTEDQG